MDRSTGVTQTPDSGPCTQWASKSCRSGRTGSSMDRSTTGVTQTPDSGPCTQWASKSCRSGRTGSSISDRSTGVTKMLDPGSRSQSLASGSASLRRTGSSISVQPIAGMQTPGQSPYNHWEGAAWYPGQTDPV